MITTSRPRIVLGAQRHIIEDALADVVDAGAERLAKRAVADLSRRPWRAAITALLPTINGSAPHSPRAARLSTRVVMA